MLPSREQKACQAQSVGPCWPRTAVPVLRGVPNAYDVANPRAEETCAFKKMSRALRQQTSQRVPPETPAVRNRTWSESLPQKEQCRRFDSPVPGSGCDCIAGLASLAPSARSVRPAKGRVPAAILRSSPEASASHKQVFVPPECLPLKTPANWGRKCPVNHVGLSQSGRGLHSPLRLVHQQVRPRETAA